MADTASHPPTVDDATPAPTVIENGYVLPACDWCGKGMRINSCGHGPDWKCPQCDPECHCNTSTEALREDQSMTRAEEIDA